MGETDEKQAKYDWAGEQGERWLSQVDRFEAMLAPIGAALLERAAFAPGDAVLDLGCGGGASTRAIADAIGPEGRVLGVDISPGLINHASAISAGKGNIAYTCADGASLDAGSERFERLHSRFGSMFFDDPHCAFANLHSQLDNSARIDLAVWANPRDNPWMMEMMGVVRNHVEVPPAEPRAPGPFAFEDLDYLQEVLNAGGFKDMQVDPYEGAQAIGGPAASPEEATRFVLSSLGVGQILAEQAQDIRDAAARDLTAKFEEHHKAGEGVMLGCKAWLVTARA
ncbi:methyltransferase type 11 [Erythrobacter longus]|uniref:Methyltransferase type 11 n=1 Tax=Erythrobacter longus TaxID=1044 RepID=A0A074N0J3_ERYLO|nr:methyltransferase domain-containing protein [Erythrobacter longus]KEO91442.1 methyltransferase type 11 [Erythrobacter longus]